MGLEQKKFSIREHTPEDDGKLWEFLRHLFADVLSQDVMAQNLMDSAQQQCSQVLIAEDENGIVGYIESRQIGFLRHHLDRAAVLPEYRQQGVFTALLTEAVTRAGVSEISAEVCADAPHLPLMERIGFKIASQQGFTVNVVKPRKKILDFLVLIKNSSD